MEDNDDSDFDVLIKLVIIGDLAVGKTNYLFRFIEREFNPVHEATVGFDYKSRICFLPNFQKKVKFQVWDTAGQERYMSLNKNLFQRVQGIILMYDISMDKSFESLDGWMKIIKQLAPNIPIILLGNKKDLENKRAISKEKGEEFSKKQNITFFETSGKTGENVDESFMYLAEEIIKLNNNNNDDNKSDRNEYIISKETSYNNKKKKKCC